MKKIISVAAVLFVSVAIFAQEAKPVIGLTSFVNSVSRTLQSGEWGDIYRLIKDKNGNVIDKELVARATNPVPVTTVVPSLKAAITQEIVNSGRFSVIDTNGIKDGLDFLFQAELTEFSAHRSPDTGGISYKMSVAVTFTNIKTNQIVMSQQFSAPIKTETSGSNTALAAFFSISTSKSTQSSDPTAMTKELASHVLSTIVNKLYPPMVLSVSKDVIQIPATGLPVGTVVDVFTQGEETIDPYTGESLGFEETLIAEIIVYEVNGRIAKAKVDPKGKFVDADIQKGMAVRGTTKKGNKGLANIRKALK